MKKIFNTNAFTSEQTLSSRSWNSGLEGLFSSGVNALFSFSDVTNSTVSGVIDDEKSVCVVLGAIDDCETEVIPELLSTIEEDILSSELLANDVNAELGVICCELGTSLDDSVIEDVSKVELYTKSCVCDVDRELCVTPTESESTTEDKSTIEISNVMDMD